MGKSVSHHHHLHWQGGGITEKDWATGSIYFRDPGVDSHHFNI